MEILWSLAKILAQFKLNIVYRFIPPLPLDSHKECGSEHVMKANALFVIPMQSIVLLIVCISCITDVDECTHPTVVHNCDVNAACANNVDPFSCTCNTGWQGNGVTCTGEQTFCFNP